MSMIMYDMFFNILQKKKQKKTLISVHFFLLTKNVYIIKINISFTNRVFFTCIWTKGTPSDVYSPESLSGTYLKEIDHRNLKSNQNLKLNQKLYI